MIVKSKYFVSLVLALLVLCGCQGSGTNETSREADIGLHDKKETPYEKDVSNSKIDPVLKKVSGPTQENAEHRLPPVIYSLNIPEFVEPNVNYEYKWSVMGYHDEYSLIIEIKGSDGEKLFQKTLSAHSEKTGAYRWGDILSTEYSYKTNITLDFDNSQELAVRFYASPINDTIDTTYLSCIIPGGLGYEPVGTSGRSIKILGLE